MTSHKRLSPGIEFNEIDRSQYDTTDYSVTGTTTHIAGFADIGQNYVTKWINSIDAFHEVYGYPQNEVERYFFNAVCEIIDRGGICYATKLPYVNPAKDNFATVTYDVSLKTNKSLAEDDKKITDRLAEVDRSLTSYLEFSLADQDDVYGTGRQRIDADNFDKYRTGDIRFGKTGQIKIVDITGGRYGVAEIQTLDGKHEKVQCLGVMPVLVGSVNSMFYRGLISSEVYIDDEDDKATGAEVSKGIFDFQPVTDFAPSPADPTLSVDNVPKSVDAYGPANFSLPLSASTIYGESVSKTAALSFPAITTLRPGTVEQRYTKRLGLAVFMAYRDDANESKISFKLVEAFSGQLDRHAVDDDTGASDYIIDKVNRESQYVNIFSTVGQNDIAAAKVTYAPPQKARSLGFYAEETFKHIDYIESIMQPLSRIFDRLQDPNQIRIDIVADAGLTNLAQFAYDYKKAGGDRKDTEPGPGAVQQQRQKAMYNADVYPFIEDADGTERPWQHDGDEIPQQWYAVMAKFNNFCKNIRRDCIFIADGFRPFVLTGNEKFARLTNIHACGTPTPRLIKNIRKMTVLDSSYSAGYSNWFYCSDRRTGDFFWFPPSIKVAGVYTYNDAYGHVWSAPAGLTRGVVRGAVDVAFNPYRDEAGEIYKQAWNYAVSYPMAGVVIEGQKTMQLQKTALDRVNVRRLMLYLEKTVVAIARRFLYEGNTAYNRQRFVDQITPIFEDAVQGDGILQYRIRCDDELNTPEIIDNNEMRCLIGVIPVKTMEWIVCNFVVGNQSADVAELVQ